MTTVPAIPPGFSTLTTHLCIKGAAKAIEFYKKAFGAEEMTRLPMPDGRIMHACLKIGNSMLFLGDEFPEFACGNGGSPESIGRTHAAIHIYVEDVDAAFKRAIDTGAKVQMPVQDMFWGDRYGRLVDPFGQPWSIATHKKELTPAQIQEGMISACALAAQAAKA